jgi:polyhydroxybutyrate depolymerase
MGGMRSAAACAAVAVLLACGGSARPPAQSPRYPHAGDYAQEVAVGQETRRYILHLPPDYAKHVPLPVVIAFHGGGGNAPVFEGASGLNGPADARGFVVLYPDGTGRLDSRLLTWNAGLCCGSAQREGVDDTGFVWAMLAELARDLDLDRTRVYAVGHSNGGMMAYRLAASAPQRIAAIVSVAGPDMTESAGSGPPVPVLHIHSLDDPRAMYAGGIPTLMGLASDPVKFRSVDDTLARWRERDGCSGTGQVVDERKRESHTAELVDFGPCAGGSTVMLWRLHGPGHGWPGGTSILPARLIGAQTRVIVAADEIFRFLPRWTRPDAPPLR